MLMYYLANSNVIFQGKYSINLYDNIVFYCNLLKKKFRFTLNQRFVGKLFEYLSHLFVLSFLTKEVVFSQRELENLVFAKSILNVFNKLKWLFCEIIQCVQFS